MDKTLDFSSEEACSCLVKEVDGVLESIYGDALGPLLDGSITQLPDFSTLTFPSFHSDASNVLPSGEVVRLADTMHSEAATPVQATSIISSLESAPSSSTSPFYKTDSLSSSTTNDGLNDSVESIEIQVLSLSGVSGSPSPARKAPAPSKGRQLDKEAEQSVSATEAGQRSARYTTASTSHSRTLHTGTYSVVTKDISSGSDDDDGRNDTRWRSILAGNEHSERSAQEDCRSVGRMPAQAKALLAGDSETQIDGDDCVLDSSETQLDSFALRYDSRRSTSPPPSARSAPSAAIAARRAHGVSHSVQTPARELLPQLASTPDEPSPIIMTRSAVKRVAHAQRYR